MKDKSQIALRMLLLVFISSGIFISSFHSHSDLEWEHTKSHCETGVHLSDSDIHCPVCGFRLKTAFTASTPVEVFETASEAAIPDSKSLTTAPYTGQTTGRSPPF